MAYVVNRLCRDCKDTACVAACPVDCFYIPLSPTAELPDQLYISPSECIDCQLCEPECPWQAITTADKVPAPFAEDLQLNARCDAQRDLFAEAKEIKKDKPTAEQVEANKIKWGLLTS
jgi:ferredoxin